MMTVQDYLDKSLERLRAEGNFRRIPSASDSRLLDFSTNDYMGIATRLDLQRDFLLKYAGRVSLTSSASRLLASDQQSYTELEALLAGLYSRETLLFNSGYHANTGMVSALADKHTLIAADRLVHASILDGVRLSDGTMRRWRHCDYDHLEKLLQKEASAYNRVLIIAESVYSMDGDAADIRRLVEIKRHYPQALLYIDEAHALGVCGPHGLGLCRELSEADYNEVDVIIGTFGKACASSGAFAAVSHTLRDYAINRARSLIFSTALPPLCCAWTAETMRLITGMDAERSHLHRLGDHLAAGLHSLGFEASPSHIQPIVIGDASKAVAVASRLLDDGVKVLPIRTPTVPPGTERLRISLSASNTEADIDRLLTALSHAL